MSVSHDADSGQLTLDRFAVWQAPEQCQAIATSTGRQCEHPALSGLPYCGDHAHLLDAVDLERMGLNRPDSGV